MAKEIIPYSEMCRREGVFLQRGMNYRVGGNHSVILMSVRPGAPYRDRYEDDGLTIIYQGHDVPKSRGIANPKEIDQPEFTRAGNLTENGKFHKAAQDYKKGLREPERVRVYEKIDRGIWSYNGVFHLVDSWIEISGGRRVFEFKLVAADMKEDKMDEEIALLVNGPREWYQNVVKAFARHGRTWLQQTKQLKPEFIRRFNDQIRTNGYFLVFGYVQYPYKRVHYRFKVDEIRSGFQRIPPPDNTAPEYATYDNTQGGCKGSHDFKYKTWLRVIECERIKPLQKEDFTNLSNRRPVRSVRGNPHYYVTLPHSLPGGLAIFTSKPAGGSRDDLTGTALSSEGDLESFIADNLDLVEEGLRLCPNGRGYNLSTGKVDLLCRDKDNNFVVVDLRTDTAGLDIVGQILSHMAEVRRKLSEGSGVRGIIIAPDFDKTLAITVSQLPQVKLMKYSLHFKFEEVRA